MVPPSKKCSVHCAEFCCEAQYSDLRLTALQFQRFYCKFPQNRNQNNTQGENIYKSANLKMQS